MTAISTIQSSITPLTPVSHSSHSSTPTPTSTVPNARAVAAAKAINVFSNDGSFLDRFIRSRKEDDEKRKQQEIINNKRNFQDRFKRRAKRPLDSDSASPSASPYTNRAPSEVASINGKDEPSAKRIKVDNTSDDIDKKKEVKNAKNEGLKQDKSEPPRKTDHPRPTPKF